MREDGPVVSLFWDKAHIWGLLPFHALCALNVPFRLVRGAAIAHGALERDAPGALIVPGGFSRHKEEALGPAGMKAIRDYVFQGGAYLGFCGGAGFGVTDPHGLNLCPYVRKPFSNRLQHFASGHIRVRPNRQSPLTPPWLAETPSLPVWWPASFTPPEITDQAAEKVEIVAAYGDPDDDFMMADIKVGSLAPGVLAWWERKYAVRLDPSFLRGGPCIVTGQYGKGRYVLSHAHLETPSSGQANAWLGHMLGVLTGKPALSDPGFIAPDLDLRALPAHFEDAVFGDCAARMDEAVALGLEHGLLYRRNAWLFGWRPGTPGFAVSNLYALFRQAISLTPTREGLDYWRAVAPHFHKLMREFHKGVTGYFLAERLAATLGRFDPGAVSDQGLADERRVLFGPPPGSGGLCGELIGLLDQLIWLMLDARRSTTP